MSPPQTADPGNPAAHATEIQVRFSDTDGLGHVNNGSYAEYAETARLDFFSRFGVRVTSIILANLAIAYRRQIVFGDPVSVTTRVSYLGTTSIKLEQQVLSRGHVAAEIHSVIVFFSYGEGQKQEIPSELRARLESSPDVAHARAGGNDADQSDGYR